MGAFTFWSYTGVLTSFSAVNSFSIPVKSLDDLQKMTDFELYIFGGGSIETLLQKWAQSPRETDIWRQKAYQKFIKTGMEDQQKLKMILDEMLIGDVSSNTALLQDEGAAGKLFEQSTHKYDRTKSWVTLVPDKKKDSNLNNNLFNLQVMYHTVTFWQ